MFWFCLLGGRDQYTNLDLLVHSAMSTHKIRSNQRSDTAKHLIRNRLSRVFMQIFFLFEGKQTVPWYKQSRIVRPVVDILAWNKR